MKLCAELKYCHSPDVYDLENYRPENADCFSVFIQVMYGPDGIDGAESFDVIVCSPAWLDHELQDIDIINGRHYLIVNKYDYQELLEFLDCYGRSCTGDTWQEVAEKLSQIGFWEFEDYKI